MSLHPTLAVTVPPATAPRPGLPRPQAHRPPHPHGGAVLRGAMAVEPDGQDARLRGHWAYMDAALSRRRAEDFDGRADADEPALTWVLRPVAAQAPDHATRLHCAVPGVRDHPDAGAAGFRSHDVRSWTWRTPGRSRGDAGGGVMGDDPPKHHAARGQERSG